MAASRYHRKASEHQQRNDLASALVDERTCVLVWRPPVEQVFASQLRTVYGRLLLERDSAIRGGV